MKRLCVWSVVLCLCAAGLAFASGGAEKASPTKAEQPKFAMKWSNSSTPDYFFNRAIRDTIARIEKDTNGGVTIQFFPNSSLGKEAEVLEMVSLGSVDLAGMGNQFAATYAPKAGVTGTPFLIKNYDHMQKVLKAGLFDDIIAEIEKKANVKVLSWAMAGIRHLTTKDIPVKTPADLKGIKIRCMPSAFYQDAVASLGAVPTPIAYSELYLALQTGVVSGQENPVTAIYDSKFYEVQKYLILTAHEYYGGWNVMAKKTWDRLPKEYKDIIQKAVDEVYVPKTFEYFFADQDKVLNTLKEKGMTVIEPDTAAFRSYSTAYMMKAYGDKWGDLIKAIGDVK